MSRDVHPAWAVHDFGRLRTNLETLRRHIGPDQGFIAALKANAYGHGALPIAKALDNEGLTAFMTGSFDEARRIKEAGLRTPVVMFAGALPAGMAELIEAGLTPTVVDVAGAQAAADAAPVGGTASVYVKVDAGLGRLGVALDDAEQFLDRLAGMSSLRVEGLYTHLPFADNAGRGWAAARLAAFDALLDRLDDGGRLPPVTQARASCCVAAGLTDRSNAVCIGHLLYGLSPFTDGSGFDLSAYRPVLAEVGTRLIHIGDHRQGDDFAIGDSYGLRHGRRAGVVPVGVSHGLPRPAPGSHPCVLIRGRRVPIVAVSLEHMVIDLDGVDDAAVGDAVLLLGSQDDSTIAFDELAAWFGKSGLDTAMALSDRLPSHYLE